MRTRGLAWMPALRRGWLGLLVLAAQIGCIVHVLRNGRNTMWIMLILFAPGIGSAVYFVIEVWPDLRAGRQPCHDNAALHVDQVIRWRGVELERSHGALTCRPW